MKTVYTVQRKPYVAGLRDAHGNTRDGWGEPEDFDVFGIAPTGSQEPDADRMAVTTGLSLLAPPGAFVGPHDLFVIDGDDWKVEGEVADYSRGPFGFAAGVVVALTRAEG